MTDAQVRVAIDRIRPGSAVSAFQAERSGDPDRPFQAIPITHSDLIPISVARGA
jgi:hypothetical protein